MRLLDGNLRKQTNSLIAWYQVAVLVVASVVPLLLPVTAQAAQVTSRSLTMSTSRATATGVQNTFDFTTATTSNVGSMEFEYCTTPLGACTGPTGLSVSSATYNSGASTPSDFSIGTNTANKIQVTRSPASINSSTALTMVFNNVTNPTASNTSFFVRITTYATASYTTPVDAGVVAGSTANQLTINARVQEILQFCVGTHNGAAPGDCSGISGTTIDLGIIDSSTVRITPVDSGDGGNDLNGAAMIRTNAVNGAVISYFAEQDTGSGQLKVPGATCSGSSTTDQCFNDSPTKTAFTAGTEAFGMTISSIDTSSGTTTNLQRNAQYNGDGSAGGGFAWNNTVTPAPIASSAGSTVKVVDDEMLVLRFAATAATTTPTGQYTVTSTYIAVATY